MPAWPATERIMRRVYAIIVLFLLLVVPFLNWRVGAVLWLIAWSAFLLKGLFAKRDTHDGGEEDEDGKGS